MFVAAPNVGLFKSSSSCPSFGTFPCFRFPDGDAVRGRDMDGAALGILLVILNVSEGDGGTIDVLPVILNVLVGDGAILAEKEFVELMKLVGAELDTFEFDANEVFVFELEFSSMLLLVLFFTLWLPSS